MTTQFGSTVKAIQCDNGKEFDNSSSCTFFLTHGMHLRMSCPYTSSQNGKAERLIRSLNNVVRCLLFQASLPSFYWVEALQTASYLLNILPTKTLRSSTPHTALSLALRPPTTTSVSLVANVIPTCLPQPPINSPLDPPYVFSWDTPLTIEGTAISISLPIE